MDHAGCTQKRLETLRGEMQKRGISWYLIPTADPHGSEYLADHYRLRAYFSGFTGSAGTLLVGLSKAFLWTDGRYFLQAEEELDGTEIILMKQGLPGVLSLTAFLEQLLKEENGCVIAADGMLITASLGKSLNRICKNTGNKFQVNEDIAGPVWEDRPPLNPGAVSILGIEYAGLSALDKIELLRKQHLEAGADAGFYGALDEVMWLYNLRGSDIEYNPVAMSYAYVDQNKAVVFLHREAITNEIVAYGKKQGFDVIAYGGVKAFLSRELSEKKKVLLDNSSLNYYYYRLVRKKAKKVVLKDSPLKMLKSVKNEQEIGNIRHFFLQDSVAVTKFLCWLDGELNAGKMVTETVAAAKLSNLRKEIKGFISESFATISAYGKNAAIVHYEPPKESSVVVSPSGFLLVDSGAQYPGVTTDVTRTIACGPLSKEEVSCFTAVAAGWVDLMNAVWPKGITGRNLDILSRQELWSSHLNFRHGTGHGVGAGLCVHEGPCSISSAGSCASDSELKAGMLITDEPGYYADGSFGIRTENTLLIVEAGKSDYGTFLSFEPMTLVPIDRRAIDKSLLSDRQIDRINAYQDLVFERISPFLGEDETKWLLAMTSDL